MVLNRLKTIILITLLGILGILNVWINNLVYSKGRKIDELKDERDIWYVKYMQSISEYYRRDWFYENKDYPNNSNFNSMVGDSNNKAISHPNFR
ncbi:MAG: hypothetical protein N2504_03715 [candidate division WOR-3 bacterium]|nr:hypothetical protein [candidate division WOR-3 bacterium]MCX7947675.1 hypothetical protein [candidate division WOR-3 bacterium]MDW8150552.1 hypothetical protein [candidate division WOR-3 bacterium]